MSTPTRAILRESVAMRLVLVVTTAILSAVTATSPGGAGPIIIGLGVVPTFAVMLGAAFGSGQHATWAWALARPISRRRWLSVHLGIDAATLVASLAVASALLKHEQMVVGVYRLPLPLALVTEFLVPTAIAVTAILYCSAAVGTSRGHNAVRAVLSQMLAPMTALAVLWTIWMVVYSPILDSVSGFFALSSTHYYAARSALILPLLGIAAVFIAVIRVFVLSMWIAPMRLQTTAIARVYVVCIAPVLVIQLVFTLAVTILFALQA
jgi:hypothetical protein